MKPVSELKSLNAKILDGTASDHHRARWEELKDNLRPAAGEGEPPRKYARADIAAEVRFAFDDPQQLKTACMSYNLGAGGIAVTLSEDLQEGQHLALELTLPGQSEVIEAQAIVVWRGEAGATGLEFTELDDVARQRIDALVWEEFADEETSWRY